MEDSKQIIDKEAALAIAMADAAQVYRDLSIYKIRVKQRDDNWYVDFDLEGEAMAGGGPHYVISARTGKILERRYEQ